VIAVETSTAPKIKRLDIWPIPDELNIWLIVDLCCPVHNELALVWLEHRLRTLGALVESCGLVYLPAEYAGMVIVTLPGQDQEYWRLALLESIEAEPLGEVDTPIIERSLPNVFQDK
jgi:hypothetical protein